jgi:tetratricopeptide (TPR) repeat protein
MNRTMIVSAGILLGICFALPPTARAEGGGGAGATEPSQKVISWAKDRKEEAVRRKKLGDQYAAQEDFSRAADEFLTALSIAPSAFTRQERLQMAIAISWADRLDAAAAVLRAILAEDPKNRDARIHLAKVLSWSDKLQEAEAEADEVLKRYPENQDALLVKANTVRWRGDARASIPIYEKALEQGENFDAQIGLAYAYLDAGEKETAKEISASLKPVYPYQKKELARFADSLCGTRPSRAGIQYSHYEDSDHNRVNRTTLSYGMWAGAWDMELSYRLTQAVDPLRRANTDDLWIATRSRQGRFDTAAEAGVTRTARGSLATGQARAETTAGRLSFGASAAREALTDTAQLIENRIVRTSAAISLAEALSPRMTLSGRYAHAGFSDSNSSDDLWLNVRYAMTAASPRIATGYRFRYWDFRRQSGGGYFDPENFNSHELFVAFYGEKNSFYVRFDPYGGYQSYLRNGIHTRGLYFGLPGAVGWTMKKCTALEISVDGGNYAGGTVAGYNYYQVGLRLIAYF